MEQTIINGFQVTIITGYYGTQLFITNADGINIYAHQVSGGRDGAFERANEVIARETARAQTSIPETVIEVQAKHSPIAICLNDRKDEFKQALKSGLGNDLTVYAGWDRDTFFVTNLTNQTEYKVELETIDNRVFATCECKDFLFRKRFCKHLAEVLQEQFFGVSLSV
jgi:SWIM zinc finger